MLGEPLAIGGLAHRLEVTGRIECALQLRRELRGVADRRDVRLDGLLGDVRHARRCHRALLRAAREEQNEREAQGAHSSMMARAVARSSGHLVQPVREPRTQPSMTTWWRRGMSVAAGKLTMRPSFLLLVLAACGVGTVDGSEDSFWDETTDDDGSDPSAALVGAKRVAIDPGKTTNAELVETLPIARNESGATRRIVMQLAPGQLPQLANGDRLITPAEVQVTTRCDIGQTAPGCNYNPNVRAQLLLTGNPSDTSGNGNSKVIATQTLSCTKSEHHCMFVFRPADATVDVGALPCVASNNCYVNLVMWAWHNDTRSGDQDKVLVGGNDGNYLDNGRVEQDQGRLMAVRERGIAGGDRAMRETNGGSSFTVNTNANSELAYSHQLKPGDLEAGEQFIVEAKLVTNVASRARVSSEMFLTRDKNATDGNGLEKIAPAQINEHNGINCTSTCTTRKVAVFKVTEKITGPVYVNVTVRSAVPGGGSTRVTVRRGDGFVKSVRYSAQLSP